MSGKNIVPRSTPARNGQPSPGEVEAIADRLAQALARNEALQKEIAAIKWQPTIFERIAAKWGASDDRQV